MKQSSYFSLYEIALLSLFGALVFVVRMAIKIPFHIPGNSGVLWVLPVIIGTALVRKPGAGTYIGIVSGLLASFFGLEALHVFDIFKYTALGVTIDLVSMAFGYRLDHPAVGFVAGAAGNMVKMVVNYAVHLFLGVQGTFILIGIGVSSVTHLVFGGLGGILAALIVGRLYRAGVVHQGDVPDEG
ncbi:ECF transporter S component [Methanoculleus bourgensis]|uniref:ECF transporter S component n=1 Tax=Methanoculleus bourgensis TaxID=83986 RepID=UPI003B92525D